MKKITYEPIPEDFPVYLTAADLELLIEKLRPWLAEEEPLKVIQISDQ